MPPIVNVKNVYNNLPHALYNFVIDDFNASSEKVNWVRHHTIDRNSDNCYVWYRPSLMRLMRDGFEKYYNISLSKNKGNMKLQGLLLIEMEIICERVEFWMTEHVYKHFKVTSFKDLFHPPVVGTPTDIEAITCFVCATNKKDRALPCGHSYCCVCVSTLPNGKCPECNTVFDKTKVIKLFL